MNSNAFVKGKVIFAGDANVGKTSIIYNFNKLNDNIQNTIVATSITCNVKVNDKNVTLNVWDTAGQDDFRVLIPIYARSAHIAVICFDQTNPQSLDDVRNWHETLTNVASIPYIMLVQNKMDLPSEVDDDKVHQLAEDLGISDVFQTSAINGSGIEELFTQIGMRVESSNDNAPVQEEVQQTQQQAPVVNLNNQEQANGKKESKCC